MMWLKDIRNEVKGMYTRISLIRKNAGMTQDKLAEVLGLTKNFISLIETGKRDPSDRTIKDICREFNVNEEWLRTGKGEMFLDVSREMEIAKFTKNLLLEETDSFKNRLISALARLSVEEWEVLEKIARNMADDNATKKE